MKKKRSTRLINAGDILLTIICLIGMAIALYLFWDDLNVSLSKQDEAPIAVVYFKKNTVQRRLVDRNLWERVQESALVYEGDRIRTSEMSEAITVFADGTEIEIHENTLIQVYTQKERAAVDFVSGAITATASGFEGEESESAPLLIKTGDKVVELDAGSAASLAAPVSSTQVKAAEGAEKSAAVAVTVTKGTAAVREAQKTDTYKQQSTASSVTKAAQNSITDFGTTARQVLTSVTAAPEPAAVELAAEKKVIQAGEVSVVKSVEQTESAAVPERNATLYLPVSSTTIRLEEGRMPILTTQWEASESLMFEFSSDASFNTTLFSRVYPETQNQAYISLEDYAESGNIFWRARFAADPDSAFANGVILLQEPLEESVQEMIDRVLNDEEPVPLKDEPDTQEEAIKAEAIRKEEEERKAREEAARLDAERAEQERLAAIRAEEERIAAEKAEEARLEAEREAAEKAIAERRLAAAKAAEEKRIAAEKAAAEKAAAEKAAAEKKKQEEIAAAQRAAEEKRIAAEKAAAAERAAAEKRAQEEAARIAAEKKAAEEAAAKAEAARIAEEKRLAEEKLAEQRAAALAAARQSFAAATPSLWTPSEGKLFDDSFFDNNRSLTFSWRALSGADSYRFVIKQKGAGFSKVIMDRYVSATSYAFRTLSDLDEGTFEWSVTGRMSDGTESQTATGTFTVKLEPLEEIQLDMSDLFKR